MNFGIVPIRPGDLLKRLETWVQQKAGLTADVVFISIAGDDYHLKSPPSDQFVTIFSASFPPWQGVVTGAGYSMFDTIPSAQGSSTNLGFDAEVIVTSFNRFNTDQEFRSARAVTDKTYGILGGFADVLGAVQMWTAPTDEDANVSYLREPMRVAGPARVLPRVYQQTFWTLIKMSFEMRFTADLGGIGKAP